MHANCREVPHTGSGSRSARPTTSAKASSKPADGEGQKKFRPPQDSGKTTLWGRAFPCPSVLAAALEREGHLRCLLLSYRTGTSAPLPRSRVERPALLPIRGLSSQFPTQAEAQSFHPHQGTDGTSGPSGMWGEGSLKHLSSPSPPPPARSPPLPLKVGSLLSDICRVTSENPHRTGSRTSTPTPQHPKAMPAVSNPAEGACFDIWNPFQKQLGSFLGAYGLSRKPQQRASRLFQVLTSQELRLELLGDQVPLIPWRDFHKQREMDSIARDKPRNLKRDFTLEPMKQAGWGAGVERRGPGECNSKIELNWPKQLTWCWWPRLPGCLGPSARAAVPGGAMQPRLPQGHAHTFWLMFRLVCVCACPRVLEREREEWNQNTSG